MRGNKRIIDELEERLPRRRLERHQGHLGRRTGTSSSSATTQGLLLKRMEECVDGDYQAFKAKGGAYIRSEFFGKYPELLETGRAT